MTKRPLAMQIWIAFGVTIGICFLLIVILPILLRSFFTPEIFSTIEHEQSTFITYEMQNMLREEVPPARRPPERPPNMRKVYHLLLWENGHVFPANLLSPPLVQEIKAEATAQQNQIQRYTNNTQKQRLFYVIQKSDVNGQPVYVISYMWDIYQNSLVKNLLYRLSLIIGLMLLLGWIPSIWMAKYITQPLIGLEKHVKRIADRDWHEPITFRRGDEIGQLAQSIERMRERLVQQDEAQQDFLQRVSHELKTPVMIIRSYVQGIHDGFFPKDEIYNAVDVIEGESARLEKRVHDLLFLTKLDYLAAHEPAREEVDLAELIEDVVERMRLRRPDLDWTVELIPVKILGDYEQLVVAFENLLDNQVRYAVQNISVALTRRPEEPACALVRIWNDGPLLDPELLSTLFEQYRKGPKGVFGLGLAIVKRIATLHGAQVWANNEEGGAAFYLQFPC